MMMSPSSMKLTEANLAMNTELDIKQQNMKRDVLFAESNEQTAITNAQTHTQSCALIYPGCIQSNSYESI